MKAKHIFINSFDGCLLLILLNSCNFYKVIPVSLNKDAHRIINQKSTYLMVHDSFTVWHIDSPLIDQNTNVLTGLRREVSRNHLNYLETTPGSGLKRSSFESFKQPEVHLYFNGVVSADKNNNVSIPLESVHKAMLYQRDKTMQRLPLVYLSSFVIYASLATTIYIESKNYSTNPRPYVPPGGGGGGGSCPFVYEYNGNELQLKGELFSGAVYPSMEYEDILPLSDYQGTTLRLLLSNQLQESDYINNCQLVAVDAPQGCEVLPDAKGKFHAIRDRFAPVSAISAGKNVLETLLHKDDQFCLLDEEVVEKPNLSSIELSFPMPAHSHNANLVLRARNTRWSELVYEQYWKMFGKGYECFVKRNAAMAAEKNKQWSIEQGMGLQVEIWADGKWLPAGALAVAGPYTWRDWLIPVALPENLNGDLRVRLKGAYRFWEIDQVSVFYGNEEVISVQNLDVVRATDGKGNDVQVQLMKKDQQYLIHEKPGMSTEVEFNLPERKVGSNCKLFLRSSGYYTSLRKPTGTPHRLALIQFNRAGAMSRYSHHLFREYLKGEAAFSSFTHH